jgi:hypothetical protein
MAAPWVFEHAANPPHTLQRGSKASAVIAFFLPLTRSRNP